MSVLITDMDKPKTCSECRFGYDGRCLANLGHKREIDITNCCPLVEVPVPHGDLIDRDELSNDGWTLHKEVMVMGGYVIHELPLKNPTIKVIIPAEEEP